MSDTTPQNTSGDDGRTSDETADNLVSPGSTATGSGTSGGTNPEDVTDGSSSDPTD